MMQRWEKEYLIRHIVDERENEKPMRIWRAKFGNDTKVTSSENGFKRSQVFAVAIMWDTTSTEHTN